MNSVKLIASQANLVNQYKNIRSKLRKCFASIYFNNQCLAKKIIPKYVNIKIANTSLLSQVTVKKFDVLDWIILIFCELKKHIGINKVK
jgi:hypothetical protein